MAMWEQLLHGREFNENLVDKYFQCLHKNFPDIIFFPTKFLTEYLLLPKLIRNKKKFKGYALRKTLRSPWKYTVEECLSLAKEKGLEVNQVSMIK